MNVFHSINLSTVKGVLIDIDDTLYSYKNSHNVAIRQCFEEFKNKFKHKSQWNFEEFNQHYRSCRTEVTEKLFSQGGCRSRLFAFQMMFENLNLEPTYVNALFFDKLYWQSLIKAMVIYQPALEFLKKCQNDNIPVCAVTDMLAEIQILKIQQLGLTDYITHLVTSEEAGVEKPNRLIFEMALKKLSIAVENTIMIGDSLKKDIHGAEQLGITAYLVEII